MPGDLEFVHHPGMDIEVACDQEIVTSYIRQGIIEGWYENDEASLARDFIRSDDTVLELGGGLGAVSAFIRKTVKPRAYTVFEPHDELHRLIAATAERNGLRAPMVDGRILRRDGMIDGHQSAAFFVHGDFWVNSTIRTHPDMAMREVGVASFEECLDRLQPSFMVCDIEGGELELFGGTIERENLRGGPGHLPFLRGVLLELHPDVIGADGVALIVRNMELMGFSISARGKSGTVLAFIRDTQVCTSP